MTATAAARKTSKRSDAQRALDPIDILSIANDNSLDGAWRAFSGRLKAAGFESCGFMIADRDVDAPLGHPDTKLFGVVVSESYLKAARENRALQARARPYRLIRRAARPVTYLREADLAGASPAERALAAEVNSAFGLKGWALAPVHDGARRLFALGWWERTSQADARALWAAEGRSFVLAATYFCESIRALVAAEADAPRLSPREMECLLWAGAGKTTMEIADLLGVADGTVEEYFSRAAKKLGAATRAQACVKAVLRGLIRP
ncbi:helix-turn-helix transcriptional regulator [Amphiplicatus metriothermophilus]|uniref:DNA-binding transcriptional regulator, CsgD family n=1 Tax=Amphiplicatus metriothermophilus TaxID=1519374 RepID=A0A239PJA4_9PROT|nr:LuxR C-terminal-related transcriptional regulator [Amphiplicatus metriothermophilus]MBB5517808.1 DNA-binding CsgD family transcriptional regulator [Amphiplicatus metriothermophilus]SNT67858.1 DNA-binding transcriptional regulator, CsgD family [Amphiplicatus metriothermophilus]